MPDQVNPGNNRIIHIFDNQLIAMKNLFALSLCLCTALSMLAQAPNANYDPDWDGDGNLGVSDLLGFLGLFGDFDTDGDGIWDSVDDCVGEYPECAICSGLDSVLFDGYYYDIVEIGNQCWFAENLRNTHYNNGDSIIGAGGSVNWPSASVGLTAIYGDDDSNLEPFGRLYNWHAVADTRGICPTGWHVPSDSEFMELEMFLGMISTSAEGLYWRGSIEGHQLKSSSNDEVNWDGSNSYGFSSIPAGYKGYYGDYSGLGLLNTIWTSSTHPLGAYYRSFESEESRIFRSYSANVGYQPGRSVRCVKD
jgi:uncharacterized protein (TIGR02145 family)